MYIMSSETIKEHLVNIKTFQTYLEHIVSSVESNRYHPDTIEKLSTYITEYYRKINCSDDDSDSENNKVELIDSDNEDSELSGIELDSTSDTTNSDDNSDDESIYLESFVNTKKNNNKKSVDTYLTDFADKSVSNSEFMIYKKYPNFIKLQTEFLKLITTY